MKAIKSLLGMLMLCITTLSYGQGPYEPINRSTVLDGEAISQTRAPVDSMAPATDPIDSSATSIVAVDSTLDSSAVANSAIALVTPITSKKLSVNYGDMNPALFWAIVIVAGLLIAWLIFEILCKVFKSNRAQEIRTGIKNLFIRKSRIPKLLNKFEEVKLEQQIKTFIADSGVNRKKYAIEQLTAAFMKECGIKLKAGLSIEEMDKLMDIILVKLLEDKRYLRFDWRPIRYAGIFLLGLLFICTLALFAFKQPTKVIINNEIPVAITPTVTPVMDPETVNEVNYTGQTPATSTPKGQIYTKVFDVPGENADGFRPVTEDWTLPYNPDGWRSKVTWTGNPVWYPTPNDYEQYIDMRAGQDVDIGDHNPEKMNFSFQSLNGQPAQVTVQYWSKVGV